MIATWHDLVEWNLSGRRGAEQVFGWSISGGVCTLKLGVHLAPELFFSRIF